MPPSYRWEINFSRRVSNRHQVAMKWTISSQLLVEEWSRSTQRSWPLSQRSLTGTKTKRLTRKMTLEEAATRITDTTSTWSNQTPTLIKGRRMIGGAVSAPSWTKETQWHKLWGILIKHMECFNRESLMHNLTLPKLLVSRLVSKAVSSITTSTSLTCCLDGSNKNMRSNLKGSS